MKLNWLWADSITLPISPITFAESDNFCEHSGHPVAKMAKNSQLNIWKLTKLPPLVPISALIRGNDKRENNLRLLILIFIVKFLNWRGKPLIGVQGLHQIFSAAAAQQQIFAVSAAPSHFYDDSAGF